MASSIRCEDCGNQPKKDCLHRRCRTCCNSKGFLCQTHVKSTWVPSFTRRRRSSSNSLQPLQNPKRRLPDITTPAPAVMMFSGIELGSNFPAEVNTSAAFRCVRVRSMEVDNDNYAYQTSVEIGGHVFKGILYDHGPDINIIQDQQYNLEADLSFTTNTATSGDVALGTIAATAPSASDPTEVPDQLFPFHQFPLTASATTTSPLFTPLFFPHSKSN